MLKFRVTSRTTPLYSEPRFADEKPNGFAPVKQWKCQFDELPVEAVVCPR